MAEASPTVAPAILGHPLRRGFLPGPVGQVGRASPGYDLTGTSLAGPGQVQSSPDDSFPARSRAVTIDSLVSDSPREQNSFDMPLNFRPATPQDIAACIEIRGRTRENAVPAARLAELGVTEASWSGGVRQGTLVGFVAEQEAALVGYCFGDAATGEIVVLALLPTHEGLGLGRQLLTMTVGHLKLLGHSRLFLGCSDDPSHRSYGFYRRLGWLPTGKRDGFGDEVLELDTSDLAAASQHPYSQSP